MSARRRRTGRRPELSQHFLRSGALASSLARQSRACEHDLVVEIGPGLGALTAALAADSRELVAVEIDGALCDHLRARFASEAHVSVVHADFLSWRLPEEPYLAVGNIPFSRTADIVRRLVEGPAPPEDAYLVVQREAAHRFAGAPRAPESLPSLLLKPRWQIEVVRDLRRADFDPPPRVDASFLWLARRPRPLVHPDERSGYERFVRACFGRGPTVRDGLERAFTARQIRRLAGDLGFAVGSPPSALTFEQWLALYRFRSIIGGRYTR